jgi:hypothetical protein
MAHRDRGEQKKHRRQKRLEKRQARERLPRPPALLPGPSTRPLEEALAILERHLSVPEPSRWPGGCDPSLARPDRVKLELAEFALKRPPGQAKARKLEAGLRQGLLSFLPDLDDWAWEEFLWHGLPGDPWHPIDAFLAQAGSRFPPPAAEQLRRWKEARLGLYEIGEVADDAIALRDWDVVTGSAAGPWFRALTLNIGGVNLLVGARGQVLLTYVAPWLPAENLFCGLGYSQKVPPSGNDFLAAYLGLQHPEVASRPLPWTVGRAAEEQYLRSWRAREWYGWLMGRLQFPFRALVSTPPDGVPRVKEVLGMVPTTPEQARLFGVYFDVQLDEERVLVAGGTHVTPLDITSTNRAALAEYHAYRKRVGPPPGAPGQPTFLNLR